MKRRFFLLSVLLAGATSPVFSNPIDGNAGFAYTPLALLCEAALGGGLLTRWGFRFFRVMGVWMFITVGTWFFLLGGIDFAARLAEDLSRTFHTGPDGLTPVPAVLPVALVILEILVVLIEAYAITRLAAAKYFREPVRPFSWRPALGISLAGNLVSFAIGEVLPLIL